MIYRVILVTPDKNEREIAERTAYLAAYRLAEETLRTMNGYCIIKHVDPKTNVVLHTEKVIYDIQYTRFTSAR